jgi:signal transduction histidine kinase
VQWREADLVGFWLGVFRIGDLVASALLMAPGVVSEIDIFVYDQSAPSDSQLLFPKGSSFESSDSLPMSLRNEEEMAFAGRIWNIVAVPAENSVFSGTSWTPWLVFALGIFATALTALYFNVVLGRSRYADALVDIRTAELVQANDARELIMQELTTTNSDLESFTYVASHDLKAPLRGMDNLVTWITEDPESSLSEESKHNAARLRIRINRLEGLLDGLLEYSRAGRLKAETITVDSRELCEEVVEYLAPPDGFTVDVGSDLPEFETVKSALQTVLGNLIANAIKHHDRKRVAISITAVDLGDTYNFSVSDDGPGIDPAHHQRVFEIFQTLTPRSKMDTSGIGLSIVTRLVAAAGGSVTIKSETGKRGTVFEFTWKKIWPKEVE